MADVALFHHVLGLTPGCQAWADHLRAAGHTVHAPDLFEGQVFASVEEGFAFVEAMGFDTLFARADAAVASLPDRLVYLGISLGVLNAQRLAQTRPGAAGAVLLEACIPLGEFGDAWPAGVPVQVHGMDADEFFAGDGDIDNARAIVASVSAPTRAELFTYPGDAHLFTDSSVPAHHPQAAALVLERVLDFLAALD
jgi:dienelactone hydrolase